MDRLASKKFIHSVILRAGPGKLPLTGFSMEQGWQPRLGFAAGLEQKGGTTGQSVGAGGNNLNRADSIHPPQLVGATPVTSAMLRKSLCMVCSLAWRSLAVARMLLSASFSCGLWLSWAAA